MRGNYGYCSPDCATTSTTTTTTTTTPTTTEEDDSEDFDNEVSFIIPIYL